MSYEPRKSARIYRSPVFKSHFHTSVLACWPFTSSSVFDVPVLSCKFTLPFFVPACIWFMFREFPLTLACPVCSAMHVFVFTFICVFPDVSLMGTGPHSPGLGKAKQVLQGELPSQACSMAEVEPSSAVVWTNAVLNTAFQCLLFCEAFLVLRLP